MLSLLEKHGITDATQIQKEIIPAIVEGRDVLAQSETGSGKTLSFAIPVIENLKRSDGLLALVLVPTRELCVQVAGEFMKFSEGKHLGVTSVYGGVSINNQIKSVKKTNIVVATPGRLIDLLGRKSVNLQTIRYLILDEADRMLDMGFINDIERILEHMPEQRQTLLFSATVSKEITELSKNYLNNPVHVTLDSTVKPEFLQQTYYKTTSEQKLPLLVKLLKNERDLVLVFCNRKHITAKIARKLSAEGVLAKCLHGDLTQPQREKVTRDFKQKKINVLVATDVAARGLHIEDISHVYNYEIPRDVESYTHRIGRTARAGNTGEAVSFVATEDERKFFKQILFTYGGNITLKNMNTTNDQELESRQSDPAQEQQEAPEGEKKKRRTSKPKAAAAPKKPRATTRKKKAVEVEATEEPSETIIETIQPVEAELPVVREVQEPIIDVEINLEGDVEESGEESPRRNDSRQGERGPNQNRNRGWRNNNPRGDRNNRDGRNPDRRNDGPRGEGQQRQNRSQGWRNDGPRGEGQQRQNRNQGWRNDNPRGDGQQRQNRPPGARNDNPRNDRPPRGERSQGWRNDNPRGDRNPRGERSQGWRNDNPRGDRNPRGERGQGWRNDNPRTGRTNTQGRNPGWKKDGPPGEGQPRPNRNQGWRNDNPRGDRNPRGERGPGSRNDNPRSGGNSRHNKNQGWRNDNQRSGGNSYRGKNQSWQGSSRSKAESQRPNKIYQPLNDQTSQPELSLQVYEKKSKDKKKWKELWQKLIKG